MNTDTEEPRILIVEDDDLMREYVVELMTSFGYSVATATDGMDAMRAIVQMPSLALIFTDIAMPGLDGIVLADMIKQHRPKIKILYTTGGSGILRMKAQAGILHGNILEKPYRPDQLRLEIERILS